MSNVKSAFEITMKLAEISIFLSLHWLDMDFYEQDCNILLCEYWKSAELLMEKKSTGQEFDLDSREHI